MSLFVDTTVWYAAADAADWSNGRAREILSGGETLLTKDPILLETWTLLRARIHREAADGLNARVSALSAMEGPGGK